MPTKVRVVPLVKEEFRADSLDDDVPGVHGARAAHQCGQDGVSGKHIALRFCQLKEGERQKSGLRTLRSLGKEDLPGQSRRLQQMGWARLLRRCCRLWYQS